MTTTQQGIITLIKSAIMEESFPLPEGFDLEAARSLIRCHHMPTLAYDGALRCGMPEEHPAMLKLLQSYCSALLVNKGQMEEVERVCAAFDAAGIDYMPLKGCNMKSLYPRPELRMMGDADILIRVSQYDRIEPVMESLGFEARADSDHELVWDSEGLHLELHKYLIPTDDKDFYSYFGDGWGLAVNSGGTRYAMTVEDEFLFLFTHFAKHYRGGGIGCRHVADLWVYRRAHPGMDEIRVRQELETLRLLEFYENIRRLMAVWFEDAAGDEKTDFMTDYLFDGGSWGTLKSKTLSRGVRDMDHSGRAGLGRLKYLRRLLFPSVAMIRNQYPILKKAPWLLPFFWVGRPINKLLFDHGSLRLHSANLTMLNPENLETRQQALRYVGLDYHS